MIFNKVYTVLTAIEEGGKESKKVGSSLVGNMLIGSFNLSKTWLSICI
jgi:hypothetical protein